MKLRKLQETTIESQLFLKTKKQGFLSKFLNKNIKIIVK